MHRPSIPFFPSRIMTTMGGSLALFAWTTFPALGIADTPVINEFVSSNGSTLADEDGDQPDWIEIYNPTDQDIDLAGWFLSDDEEEPLMWEFPSVMIEPDGFLIVFASNKDRRDGPNLHTNFAISSEGEPLLLSNPQGELVDFVPPVAVGRDDSYGRQPDGSDNWGFFDTPTPGFHNTTTQYAGILPKPVLSHEGGFYGAPLEVEILESVESVVYHVTFDGSIPTTESAVYTDPIFVGTRDNDANQHSMIRTMAPHFETSFPETNIKKATIMRVRGFREGWLPSPVMTRTFIVDEQEEQRYSLPVLSLVSDHDGLFSDETGILVPGIRYDPNATNPSRNNFTGNYMMRGEEWERPVHLEFWEEDGTNGFSLDAGVRVHGGAGRMFERKSLRLYFRSEYGQSTLNYPIFKDGGLDEFDRVIVRAGSQDRYHAMMRDELGSELARNLNIDRMRWRPLILFLNGEYWGIKYFRDRLDNRHLSRLYGLDPGNLDGIDRNGTVTMGTRHYWNSFNSKLSTLDPSKPSDFTEISRWMDMDSYVDYLAINIFLANADWPANNVEYWRHRAPELPEPNSTPVPADGRWRWLLIDLDITSGFLANQHQDPTLARITATGSWESRIIDSLIDFPEFRQILVNRILDLLNSDFHPNNTYQAMDKIRSLITPEMPENTLRWPPLSWTQPWQTHLNSLSAFIQHRPSFLRGHLNSFFDLDGEGPMVFDVTPPRTGSITINTWAPEPHQFPVHGTYLTGLPITLRAEPANGYRFVEWRGETIDSMESTIVEVNPQPYTEIKAVFTPDPDFDWEGLGWPSPAVLADDAYTLDFFAADTPAGFYPANMIFLQTDVPDPRLDDPMIEPYIMPYDLSSRSRFAGLGDSGIGMINTSNPQEDGGGFLGGVVLALNTLEVGRAEVRFTAGTVLPNERPYALRLRARVGVDTGWFDVLDEEGDPVEYTGNVSTGHFEDFGPITLPNNLMGHPYVQLKWRYHALPTTVTGPRAFLRLDNLQVTGYPSPDGWLFY